MWECDNVGMGWKTKEGRAGVGCHALLDTASSVTVCSACIMGCWILNQVQDDMKDV